MKYLQILSHSVTQVISFCMVLVGSPYFGGPFGFFIYHSALEGYAYGVIGILAVVATLMAVFVKNKLGSYIQFGGLLLMVLSLGIFFFSSQHFINANTFHEALPLLTLLLFLVVVVFVARKTLLQSGLN